MLTNYATLPGGWSIEYVHGLNKGDTGIAFHVLRVFGDITRPKELRAAIETYRQTHNMAEGEIKFHTP